MKQEVKDFLSKAEIKLVEPYLVTDNGGREYLCIAEDITKNDVYLEKMLCIAQNSVVNWLSATSVTPIQPKSRSIEDGLVEGDIITNLYGDRKVLMANQYCVIISLNDLSSFGGIYSYQELIEMDYTLKQ